MKIYNLEELTCSQIMYDRKPPRFMQLTIYVFLLLLITAIIVANFTYKTNVVKAQSIVTTENKTMIMSPIQGEIEKINIEEGSKVKKGDILIEFNSLQLDIKIKAINEQIDYLENEYINPYDKLINTLEKLTIDNIETYSNPFLTNKFYKLQFDQIIERLIETKNNKESETIEKKEQIEAIKNQYKTQLYSQKSQYDYELTKLKSEKITYEDTKKNYILVASADGIIHLNVNLKEGLILGLGNAIGSISPDITDENVIIETYIPVNERSFVKEGQEVEIAIAGIMQSDYGILKGKILEISTDTTASSDGKSVFFVAKIKPQKVVLDNKNKKIYLKNGLMGESRIKYENITWLKWVGKQIGIVK